MVISKKGLVSSGKFSTFVNAGILSVVPEGSARTKELDRSRVAEIEIPASGGQLYVVVPDSWNGRAYQFFRFNPTDATKKAFVGPPEAIFDDEDEFEKFVAGRGWTKRNLPLGGDGLFDVEWELSELESR